MNTVSGKTFDEERALYGLRGALVADCTFSGPEDGESALKECSDITVEHCLFNLRYPCWHDHRLTIRDSELTENGRAALWYSEQVDIAGTRMHGIKAIRECRDVTVRDCDIISNEFGWFTSDMRMEDCTVKSDYFMLHSSKLQFAGVKFTGKYALQYLRDCVFENCDITSRDAFWHAENVVVRNSFLRGEFLGWYSDDLVLDHCRILSSQPLCYCRNLRLIDCEVIDSDLCFEKSDLDAVITTPVDSIKNPLSGRIVLPAVDELIRDDPESKAEIVLASQGRMNEGTHEYG
ncbi:MAG: DUF3737 family protein, partial [Desulfovibrionaceae bacterium]|nr:DUF3737 family protein [Desulfovibrionaceae bacterium]